MNKPEVISKLAASSTIFLFHNFCPPEPPARSLSRSLGGRMVHTRIISPWGRSVSVYCGIKPLNFPQLGQRFLFMKDALCWKINEMHFTVGKGKDIGKKSDVELLPWGPSPVSKLSSWLRHPIGIGRWLRRNPCSKYLGGDAGQPVNRATSNRG